MGMGENGELFGKELKEAMAEKAKKEAEAEKESVAEKFRVMGYNEKDVVSAWIKSMRLGRVEDALYWLQIMEKAGVSWWYIGMRLVIFAYEDAFGPGPAIYANAAFEALKITKGDENINFSLTEYMCRAPKFWENEAGGEREWSYLRTRKEIKNGNKYRQIPEYAKDGHCRAGFKMREEKGYYDNRFSGDTYGRVQMMKMFKRLKKLDPNDEQSKEELIKGWKQGHNLNDWKPSIKPLSGHEYLVQSQSDPNVSYKVDVKVPSCTCPHHENRGAFCKHMKKVKEYIDARSKSSV